MTSPRFLIQGLYLGYGLQNWLRIWPFFPEETGR